MKFEEEYEDVLQNLESAIIRIYRNNPELVDHDVRLALKNLTRTYQTENSQREPRLPTLTPERQELHDAVKEMCDWRMGRIELSDDFPSFSGENALSTAEIIKCLKRIQKSVDKWNKNYGRQGYLDFVSEFIV